MDAKDAFIISDKDWKTFKQEKPKVNTPCWLKLRNNNIVLASYGSNGQGATGWWKVFFEDGWKISGNEGFLAREATWQPCALFIEE